LLLLSFIIIIYYKNNIKSIFYLSKGAVLNLQRCKDLVQKNDIEQGLEEYIPIQLQCSQDDLV